MPFKSEAQRRLLWMKHPDVARRWSDEYPDQKKLPYHKKKKVHKMADPFGVAKDSEVSKYDVIRPKGERKAVLHSRGYWAGVGSSGAGGAAFVGGLATKKPALTAAGAAGILGGYAASNISAHKAGNKYRKMKGQPPRKYWSGQPEKVKKSAFGVDHEISKLDRRHKPTASGGRLMTGALFPGFHGAVAGKKGHKLPAVGYELGGTALGSVVPGPGSVVGAGVGTELAHRAGHYKKQKVKKSAFDVDHEVSKTVLLPKPFKGGKKMLKPIKPAKPGANSKTDNTSAGGTV